MSSSVIALLYPRLERFFMHDRLPPTKLIWKPGEGPCPAASQRLREAFPRPRQAMGEAWFMSDERKLYRSLLNDTALTASDPELSAAVENLASGPTCFGPRAEWTEWLHYLLGRLPALIDDWQTAELFETCVTAVVARYPAGRTEAPYTLFFDDMLASLGRSLLSDKMWLDGRLVGGKVLSGVEEVSDEREVWARAGGAFSASLFLTAKYVADESLPSWWQSVVAIDDPIWRADLLLWLAAASPMFLDPEAQPADLELPLNYGAGWEWCHCLKGAYPTADEQSTDQHPFLPTSRQQAMVECFRDSLSADRLLAWNVALEAALPRNDASLIVQSQLQEALDRCISVYKLS